MEMRRRGSKIEEWWMHLVLVAVVIGSAVMSAEQLRSQIRYGYVLNKTGQRSNIWLSLPIGLVAIGLVLATCAGVVLLLLGAYAKWQSRRLEAVAPPAGPHPAPRRRSRKKRRRPARPR